MFKFLKFLFGFVAVVLMALLVIPFFVNVNDYKPEIKQAVYDATGRNLEIGNIKLSLFPWVGITLTDIQFENALGFKHENMLEVGTVDVQVALMPLFDQQIEVRRFELNAPKIWLTQHEDGRNNWSDLSPEEVTQAKSTPTTDKTSAPKKKQTTGALPIAFEAKLLQLRDGQVIWHDADKGEVVINDIQLNITDLQLKQPIGIDLSANIGANPIRINAEIGPVLDIKKFDIAALPALISIKSKGFSLQPFAKWLPDLDDAQQALIGKLADINIDVIVQNVSEQDYTDITFTVPRDDYNATMKLLNTLCTELKAKKVKGDDTVAKVSIIGVGMRSHAGVARKMFDVLSKENINIQMITTSEIKVTVVVDEKYVELAVRALHTAFDLDAVS